MKSMFLAHGFQSNNIFTLRHPSMGGRGPALGLTGAEIDQYTAKITGGRAKLAQLRAWIAARIDNDPMLARGFNDPVVQKNFWDFMDLIDKDQYYADQTWNQIQNPSSADYDISEENLGRTDEWALVINNAAQGMQFYKDQPGTVKPTLTPMGPVKPGTLPGYPGYPGTVPGVLPGTVPAKPSTGVSTQDLLVGGAIALGVGALLYAIL